MTLATAKIQESKANLGLILGLSLGLSVSIPLMLFMADICLYLKHALQSEDHHEIQLTDYGAMANTEQPGENPLIDVLYSVENENAATNIPLSTMP